MRDPYDVLGIARGATFDEVRAAYRRACKTHHPDMGGSHEAMVELNAAYAFILNELKQGARQSQEAPKQEQASGQQNDARREERASESAQSKANSERDWRNFYRDIDEELEELRRTSTDYEARQRAMRKQAWESGQRFAWAKLTWDDLARFVGNLARGGIKGLATLFAALVGVGTVLVEANLISALIILGSGLGFVVSLALKSDKAGYMSAALLMFGVATIWLPPLRAALFGWPLATISVLICIALIFKFAQGGIAGWMTGGVLGIFLISVILDDPERQRQQTAAVQKPPQPVTPVVPSPSRPAEIAPAARPAPVTLPPTAPQVATRTPSTPLPASPPKPAEPRELLAAQGSILKFVAGIDYQLKVRSGLRTRLVASSGTIAFYRGDIREGDCVSSLDFSTPAATTPYINVERLIRACGKDAVFQVSDVR